jgi:GNAT superfamily N-acetyltransferase
MSTVTVRPALHSEQEALEDIMRRASLANDGDREALLLHPEVIALPLDQLEAGLVFAAELDGETAGFAALLDRDDGEIELDGLFTEPDRWRRGVGRALIQHCAAFARARGATTLHVIANFEARGFYERCGFVETGPFETQFGPALRMELRL